MRPFLIMACLGWCTLAAQIQVDGQLQLDSIWEPKLYASRIEALTDLYRCAPQMIIAEAEIDTMGYFRLYLPPIEEIQLIRLHVSKKYAPAAMLIIGGPEQNHGFLAVENEEVYQLLKNPNSVQIFSHFFAIDPLNQALRKVEDLVTYWDEIHATEEDALEQEVARTALVDALYHFSDTTTFLLPKLYALSRANMGYNTADVGEKLKTLSNQRSRHPYLEPFQEAPRGRVSGLGILIGLAVLLIGVYIARNQYQTNTKKRKINLLSPQERKVARLLRDGKSNKEIADVLHVEVSTVKSHIYRIFNKLEIDSRREVTRFSAYLP
ncbi:MAG: LuxR C-terminal-related transcriptional regulator [Saprospiraceae bacterium]|nr:LuxR C-terminal-related transcriptional regulator [Saprospiraceae bacterium]